MATETSIYSGPKLKSLRTSAVGASSEAGCLACGTSTNNFDRSWGSFICGARCLELIEWDAVVGKASQEQFLSEYERWD